MTGNMLGGVALLCCLAVFTAAMWDLAGSWGLVGAAALWGAAAALFIDPDRM